MHFATVQEYETPIAACSDYASRSNDVELHRRVPLHGLEWNQQPLRDDSPTGVELGVHLGARITL